MLEDWLRTYNRFTYKNQIHPFTDAAIQEVLRHIAVETLRTRLHQRDFQRYSFALHPRQYVSGESHRYLGLQYRHKVVQSEERQESVHVHELCHLVEHNQALAFYALLARIMPNWKEKRENLGVF